MTEKPDDLSRLIHETLETIGWEADPDDLARQVRRLDVGLPAEDEFSVVCSWLGKCDLIHKLDQHQMPRDSSETFQVPDLVVRFSTQSNDRPLLVEVKTKTDKKLSFRPDYFERLQNYASLMGMPLLIAWRYHSVWMLFEARHLKKAVKNYNISLHTAMCENLLGLLAGDFSYRIGQGAGIHLRIDKENLLSEESQGEVIQQTWQMRIGEVAFTDRDGKRIDPPSSDTQSLFEIWDLEEEKRDYPDFVHVSFTAPAEGMQFAHMSLVRLLNTRTAEDEKLSWRRVAKRHKITSIENFRKAIDVAMAEKVVQFILNQVPHTRPDFVG